MRNSCCCPMMPIMPRTGDEMTIEYHKIEMKAIIVMVDWFKRKSRRNHGNVASDLLGLAVYPSSLGASQISEASPCVVRPDSRVRPM